MSMFETIHIHGFRRLYDVDLKRKPLNVVIGANGSGKTSLLDVFSLLAASASGRLKETMSDLSGIEANLTNLLAAKADKARFMAFDLRFRKCFRSQRTSGSVWLPRLITRGTRSDRSWSSPSRLHGFRPGTISHLS